MEKREILVEVKAKTSAVIIKEFSKDGAIMQYNSNGEVKGKYHASHIETVDTLFKMDGTSEWESRGMDMTKDGDLIMMTAKGTGQPENMTTGRFQGEVTFMTNSAKLGWLNQTKGRTEGKLDYMTGDATYKVYAEKLQATVAVPTPM